MTPANPTPLTDDDVAAIAARVDKALKGGVFAVSMYDGDVTYTLDRAFDPCEIDDSNYVEHLAVDIDDSDVAAFIANAPADLRALLADRERLAAENARLRERQYDLEGELWDVLEDIQRYFFSKGVPDYTGIAKAHRSLEQRISYWMANPIEYLQHPKWSEGDETAAHTESEETE